jgi:hypothetical protein
LLFEVFRLPLQQILQLAIVGAVPHDGSCRPLSSPTIAHFHYNLGHMSAPPFERIVALAEKFVALIDCCDPGDCARLVVENLVGNVEQSPIAPSLTRRFGADREDANR